MPGLMRAGLREEVAFEPMRRKALVVLKAESAEMQ